MVAVRRGLLVALVLAGSTSFLSAAETAQKVAKPLTYLKLSDYNWSIMMPPPPAPDSLDGKADKQTVRDAEKIRTADDVARAMSEKKAALNMFNNVVGKWLTDGSAPKTLAFMNTIGYDSGRVVTTAKDYFSRERPYVGDADAHPLMNETDKSYPSGHSTRGSLYAMVLSELMPDLKDKLLARGREIGWDRVIAGVHFPSDVYEGRAIAAKLMTDLMANPKFQKDLADAKAEIEGLRSKQTAAVFTKPSSALNN